MRQISPLASYHLLAMPDFIPIDGRAFSARRVTLRGDGACQINPGCTAKCTAVLEIITICIFHSFYLKPDQKVGRYILLRFQVLYVFAHQDHEPCVDDKYGVRGRAALDAVIRPKEALAFNRMVVTGKCPKYRRGHRGKHLPRQRVHARQPHQALGSTTVEARVEGCSCDWNSIDVSPILPEFPQSPRIFWGETRVHQKYIPEV